MHRRSAKTVLVILAVVVASASAVPSSAGPHAALKHKRRVVRPTTTKANGPVRPASGFRTATATIGARMIGAHAGNQVVSPVSITAALSMLSLGAGGTTRRELELVLGIESTDQQRNAVTQALASLAMVPPNFDSQEQVVRVANALWVQKGLALKPSFVASMREGFGAPVRPIDFASSPGKATDAINSWASEQTFGHIPKIVDGVNPGTLVVLANALYAKLTWLFEADPQQTTTAPFTRSDRRVVQTPTMQLSVPHGAAETVEGVDMAAIPYRGDYEMVVAATGDPRLLGALDRPLIGEYSLSVRMPMFEARSSFDLLRELASLLPRTFGPTPDLSEMGVIGAVDKAVHSAWTKTDEHGTEGAAVTVITVAASAPPPRTIVLDKTFTYIVRHKPTGLVVFMGRVDDPTAPVPAS